MSPRSNLSVSWPRSTLGVLATLSGYVVVTETFLERGGKPSSFPETLGNV